MSKTETGKRNRPFRSLRVTLAISFYILVSVVLTILGVLFLYFNLQTYHEAIAGEQNLIAQGAANTVKGFIQEKINILESSVNFGEPISLSQEEQKTVLDKLLRIDPAFRQLLIFDKEKQELNKASRLSGATSGNLPGTILTNSLSQVEQNKPCLSPVYIDEASSEPLTIIAVPIMDLFGDFEGSLVAEVNLKFMWDLVASINVGETGLAYVVDKQGDLIAFKNTSLVLRGENLSHLDEVNEFIKGEVSAHSSTPDIVRGIQGDYIITNHAHLGEPDWAVIIELPVKEAYALLIRHALITFLVLVATLGLTVCLVVYFSRSITNPIISLRNTALEIRKGKLDVKSEIKSRDEIGDLAVTFNEMADRLKQYTAGLEKEVEERTKELKEAKDSLEIRVKARTKELEELTDQQEETIENRTREIKKRAEELERFQKLAVGRELKMIALKKEIKQLKKNS